MNPHDQANAVAVRLRKAGYNVVIDDMPPRPWLFTPNGVLLHHTASTSVTSVEQERNDVRVLKSGTDAWPPPHTQWYVGRTGRIYLLAKGGANHAGTGELIEHGIPANQGNAYLWGIEVQSDGYGKDWTKDQWAACHALTGELLRAMGKDADRVWRHKDYDDDSGKVDTRYPLEDHRRAVRAYLNQEEEVTKDDLEKIEQIVAKAVEDAIPVIAKKCADTLLASDIFPKNADIDKTVRKALREASTP